MKTMSIVLLTLGAGLVAQTPPPAPKPSATGQLKSETIIRRYQKETSVVKVTEPTQTPYVVDITTAPALEPKSMSLWAVSGVKPAGFLWVKRDKNVAQFTVPHTAPESEFDISWSGVNFETGEQFTTDVRVKVGKGPRPPPGPEPGPDPGPDPTPDGKPLIEDPANHVLIIYETGDQASYTQGQIGFMYSQEVRTYLTEKCPKGTTSSGWYMLDKDAVTAALPPYWTKAMQKPRSKMPYMILSNPKGGWEGPIPERYEDAFAKVKEFIK